MTAAVSPLDLVSQAYVLIGLSPIQSMTETTNKGTTAQALYDTLVASVASMHTWRFMMKRAQLVRLAETPLTQWKYYYQLPTDQIGPLYAVYETTGLDARPLLDFDIDGRKLATNVDYVYVDYQALPSVAEWPAFFKQLIIYALAAHFAEASTDQTSKAEYWHKIAFGTPEANGQGGYFMVCKTRDSQGHPPPQQRYHPFIDIR